MKAIAVKPGQANSIHMVGLPRPSIDSIPNGRGVLVKVLQVGVDATDREINDALYGQAPDGDDFLVLGHECFGQVAEVGPGVTNLAVGDYVTCTVRRPGTSIYDHIGRNDITSEETYFERGINLLHGYLTEYFVDDEEYMVKMPVGLKHLHVLAEPMSCAAKAVEQAYLAQHRLQVWRPQLAFVLGSGQIGLLTTLILRLKGLEVYTIARTPGPSLKSELVEALGAHYVSTAKTSLRELSGRVGRPDLILDATGNSAMAFGAMEILAHNGALVWTSITGGQRTLEIPSDRVNIEWVLGNKLLVGSVNANRHHFEAGIQYLAFGETMFPGVVERMLTHPVDGLDNFAEMMRLLVDDRQALKVFVNVAHTNGRP